MQKNQINLKFKIINESWGLFYAVEMPTLTKLKLKDIKKDSNKFSVQKYIINFKSVIKNTYLNNNLDPSSIVKIYVLQRKKPKIIF